ncbi:hypothetical protein K431DRAFT_285411 [Polychaeton citri CBS 116435]|uniref:Uncharacterized protein n=1 Tax=Polychaeton citri CBS 116435 TaxID=1314669 RepID=A0A9P4Q741_9PEZI|nr:hypothetical protein K431DRAFT_285411 [Polychaeton citri CBS 116435]
MASRYRSLSGNFVDNEKQEHTYDSDSDVDAPSLAPSRDLSHQPILASGKPRISSHRYHLPRRRFTRYFTLVIALLLFVFISTLVKASWASRATVELGPKKDPKPPAWEQFPFLKRYHGGIRKLVQKEANVPEYPKGNDEELKLLIEAAMQQKTDEDKIRDGGFQKRDEGDATKSSFLEKATRFDPFTNEKDADVFEPRVKCYLDNKTKSEIPQLLAYKGVTEGFPEPVYGSHELFGLRNDVCFERFGRLGPYGYGYSRKYGGSGAGIDGHREGAELVWGDELEIDYRGLNWAHAQQDCAEANAHRFKTEPGWFGNLGAGSSSTSSNEAKPDAKGPSGKKLMSRTAVIIRTWWDYQYDQEDMFYLRALINELSLQSGNEYTIHFLVHVKDDNLQIWADEQLYQETLNNSLPEEFRGMGTLWTERQMGLIYGGMEESNYRGLPVHGAYRSTYMPVQYFAHIHPEYDFFWHWEMDIRYTGHFYHLFSKIGKWAKQQPRKGLWERNSRFYLPSEHGSYDEFRTMVKFQLDHGTAHQSSVYNKMGPDAGAHSPFDVSANKPEKPVWGPEPPTGPNDVHDNTTDIYPPEGTSYDKDNYVWGVGEEADLITFNPLFDPHTTNWILAEDVTGYDTSAGYPPRRTAIITASRLSRRLLETMHQETSTSRHTMFSEMWPGSCALHHGFKAVYAPHAVYIDRAWPTSYLNAVFNNGRNGAAGGARTSVFSDERQHNFLGTTWYYHAGFSPNLWKRWLGFKVDNDGGEEEELAGEGRLCVPAMLLHPVKQVDLIFEHQEGEAP